ncbi:polysaccharide biosynthesis C-terminal domain-containing protein [Ruoffia tabacinasalis]|uniref:polysaccharide biosynthesis C-terminal domain-containing protein n=1 Tax=Ruoffia tabacinasalis TaxID=87458 RepID=UPI0030D3B62F
MIETIAHTEDVLPQKWNGVAQHIAYTITNSTDIVVLTVFSTLENVSIYSVYNLVINGLKLLISSLTSSIQSFFGNLLAKEEYNTLGKFFSKIEWIIHTLVTNIFSITSVLITPFILIYTAGVQDVSYNVPVFGFLITMTQMLYCLRLPYYLLVNAAGQFKETQNGAIVEAIINVVISVLIVNKYGLIGVAIGTIIALGFRTIYLVIYLSNNILKRPATLFLKQIIVDLVTMCLIHLASLFVTVKSYDFFSWVYLAIIISCISLIISFIINYLFYNDRVLEIIKKLESKREMLRKIFRVIFYSNINSVVLINILLKLRENNNKILSILLWNKLIVKYGIHIGNRVKIGKNLILPHPLSIVIGNAVKIGDNCTLYHNVTLGTKHSLENESNGYPELKNNVIIYTNTVIIGDIVIGENTIVGSNSLVTTDLEANSVYAGNPLKKIR